LQAVLAATRPSAVIINRLPQQSTERTPKLAIKTASENRRGSGTAVGESIADTRAAESGCAAASGTMVSCVSPAKPQAAATFGSSSGQRARDAQKL